MIDTTYLYKGLCALARAERANAMAGHLGAAVIAGCFFLEQHPELEGSVQTAIVGELDRIIGGEESLWFDPTVSGITIPELFEPFPNVPFNVVLDCPQPHLIGAGAVPPKSARSTHG